MEIIRLGSVFRAVRIRKGWRQVDVATAAKVSQAMISRIERGRVRGVSLAALMQVAEALEIRIDVLPRWRGGDLDRMLNAGHAALHQRVARMFAGTPWLLAPETTFAVYGERGVIDILAFHPPTGALLIIELKTDLVDVQQLMTAADRYRRLAPRVARERGWNVRSIGVWVALRDTRTNRRRVGEHADILRLAFPGDGRSVRRWSRSPDGPMSALSFIPDEAGRPGAATSSGVRRVRRRRAA
ncbi:MAG: helix-turn-helix domain-containing protein [Candidatus Limnocylindria bacterium]